MFKVLTSCFINYILGVKVVGHQYMAGLGIM